MSRTTEHLPTHMPTRNRPANLGASLDDHTSRLDAVEKVTGRTILETCSNQERGSASGSSS